MVVKILTAPLNLCFAITGRCNLKCKHCSAKDTWKKDDLSQKKLFDVIDQIGSAKVFDVAIFGGGI